MKFCIRLLCAVALLLPMSSASAFWSFVLGPVTNFGDHQDITGAALSEAEVSIGGEIYNFQPVAIDRINAMHAKLDKATNYNRFDHFDSDELVISLQTMQLRRQQVIKLLDPSYNGTPSATDQQLAWDALGALLHALQDFYAHSTWVETHQANETPLHFAAQTAPGAPLPPGFMPSSGQVCLDPGYSLLTPVNELLTGYYNLPAIPLGACEHGTLSGVVRTCATTSAFHLLTVPGISKDSPCAQYPAGPADAYTVAMDLARRDTKELLAAVISDVATQDGNVGLCMLVGLGPGDVCPTNTPSPPSQVTGGTGGGTSSPSTPPKVTLTPSSPTVVAGQSVTLQWSSSNADYCEASWISNNATSGSAPVGPLAATAQFTITCTNATTLGSASDTTTVTVTPAPTVTLSATPTTIASGQTTTLTWNAVNATSCSAIGGWTSSTATSGSATVGPLTASATFSMVCSDAQGNQSPRENVPVTVTTAVTADLKASPTTVSAGSSTQLTWSSTNATSCTTSGWATSTATSGSATVGPINSTISFSITCTDASGTVSASKSVTVTVDPVSVNLTATPDSVLPGDQSVISWTAINAVSCSATNGWTPSTATSGNAATGPLSTDTTYSMSCTDANGNQSAPASVTVTVGKNLPTLYIYAAPQVVSPGGSTLISWVSANTTSCAAVGGWTPSTAVNDAVAVGPLASTTKYTMTCTGAGYSATTSTVVQVVPAAPTICIPKAGATACAVTLYDIPDSMHSGFVAPTPGTITTVQTNNGVTTTVVNNQNPLGVTIYDNVNGPPLSAPVCNYQLNACPHLVYHHFEVCQVDGKWNPVTYHSVVSSQVPFSTGNGTCSGQPERDDIITGYNLTADGVLTGTDTSTSSENRTCNVPYISGPGSYSTTYNSQTTKSDPISINLRDGSGSATVAESRQSSSTNSLDPNQNSTSTTSVSGAQTWPSEPSLPPKFPNMGIVLSPMTVRAGQPLPVACTAGATP
jgi:hypothetical protein